MDVDALRRALVLLDELDGLVDDFYPFSGRGEISTVESVRLPILNALNEAEYQDGERIEDPPTQDSVVLGVLRERWTAWLAVMERELMRGFGLRGETKAKARTKGRRP